MRIYQLYLVKEQLAAYYFGKENKFFRLFKEYASSSGEKKKILEKQINFITQSIPRQELHQYIQKYFYENNQYSREADCYFIRDGNLSQASLEIFDHRLVLTSTGNYYAETIFFEALRKYESSFLAIDLYNNQFGWLRPIKKRKFV